MSGEHPMTFRSEPVQRRPELHSAGAGDQRAESYGFVTGILPSRPVARESPRCRGHPSLQERNPGRWDRRVLSRANRVRHRENSSLNDAGFFDPTKPDRSLEAEYAAFVAAGGSKPAGVSFNNARINNKLGLPTFPAGSNFDLPFGRIDLVGITSTSLAGTAGKARNLVDFGRTLGVGNPNSGTNRPVNTGGATATARVAGARGVARSPPRRRRWVHSRPTT